MTKEDESEEEKSTEAEEEVESTEISLTFELDEVGEAAYTKLDETGADIEKLLSRMVQADVEDSLLRLHMEAKHGQPPQQ